MNSLIYLGCFITNFGIINNAPAWINFDEGRVFMDGRPHPPALLLKEKGAESYTFCTFEFLITKCYTQYHNLTATEPSP